LNATGAGSGSAASGVLEFVVGDMLVASSVATPSDDGNRGLKMVDAKLTKVPPTIPPTTRKARANATRFMEETLFRSQ
jgi:hypothetical protein